jgi:predicted cupin superfamily sugar epimerase
MSTKGQTDWMDPKLISTHDRPNQQTDTRRNALTSIFWIPTIKSSKLLLGINKSDHVHYYQGGKPFEYLVYHPETKVLEKHILGPDLRAGHKLQVIVPGGSWKCGQLVLDFDQTPHEYAIIGEGVGPGFDFHDFYVCVEDDLKDLSAIVQDSLRPYLHANLHKDDDDDQNEPKMDFEGHYEPNDKQEERIQARS